MGLLSRRKPAACSGCIAACCLVVRSRTFGPGLRRHPERVRKTDQSNNNNNNNNNNILPARSAPSPCSSCQPARGPSTRSSASGSCSYRLEGEISYGRKRSNE
jgi:hypothetical protein